MCRLMEEKKLKNDQVIKKKEKKVLIKFSCELLETNRRGETKKWKNDVSGG